MLMAIEEPMRLGKNAETAQVFEKVAKRDAERRISIMTDFKGNVTYSTNREGSAQGRLAPFLGQCPRSPALV